MVVSCSITYPIFIEIDTKHCYILNVIGSAVNPFLSTLLEYLS